MKTTLFTLCLVMSTLALSNEFPLPQPMPYFTAVSPIFGYDPAYGARPLKRYLQRELETLIARKIIAGDAVSGAKVTIVKDGDHLGLKVS